MNPKKQPMHLRHDLLRAGASGNLEIVWKKPENLERETVITQAQLSLQELDFLLQVGNHRYTVAADDLFHLVFLLSGGIDARLAGGFGGGAQFAQDLPGGVFEILERAEGLDVHGHEEVPDAEGLLAAVRGDTG